MSDFASVERFHFCKFVKRLGPGCVVFCMANHKQHRYCMALTKYLLSVLSCIKQGAGSLLIFGQSWWANPVPESLQYEGFALCRGLGIPKYDKNSKTKAPRCDGIACGIFSK